MTTKIKTGIKLKVNPKQSLYVQNICFANGIYWPDAGKNLHFPEEAVYYINIRQEHMTWNEIAWIYCDPELEEVDTMLFIRTSGTCVEEETKTNKEDEESEMVTEEKVYKNAKEYLVEKGLYDLVIHNYFNEDDKTFGDRFSSIFTWSETKEGYTYWYDIDRVLRELDINYKIDEILEDIALKEASNTKYLTEENIKELMEGLEPVDEEGVKEQPKQYLVYVEGKQSPKKVHNSLKSAQKEANRLAKTEVGRVVYVVEIVNKYKGTVTIEEIK